MLFWTSSQTLHLVSIALVLTTAQTEHKQQHKYSKLLFYSILRCKQMITAETAVLGYGVIAPGCFLHHSYMETPFSRDFLTGLTAIPSAQGTPENCHCLVLKRMSSSHHPSLWPGLGGRWLLAGNGQHCRVVFLQ